MQTLHHAAFESERLSRLDYYIIFVFRIVIAFDLLNGDQLRRLQVQDVWGTHLLFGLSSDINFAFALLRL